MPGPCRSLLIVLALSLSGMAGDALLAAPPPKPAKPVQVPPSTMPPLPPASIDNTLAIGGEDIDTRMTRTRMTVEVHVNRRGPYRFVVDSGADSVLTASTVPSGLEAIDSFKPTLAMLDINLGDSMSYAIADKLQEIGVPYIFASGYGEQAQLPAAHGSRTVLQKPYTLENIARCLDELSERRSG